MSEFGGDAMSGLYDWSSRMGSHRVRVCPECGKGLGQDDAYGHDCEVS